MDCLSPFHGEPDGLTFYMDDPGIKKTRCLFQESEFLGKALFLGHQKDFKVTWCNRHLFPCLCANELVFKVHNFIISHIDLGIFTSVFHVMISSVFAAFTLGIP